jgi:Carboxypeptidase regulatory-like domain
MKYSTFCKCVSDVAKRSLLLVALLMSGVAAMAQVTTSTISGLVTDDKGEGLVGATVVATHVPSGTRYGSTTNETGRYFLPAVRVGGPFSITVTYTGYDPQTREGIFTSLGTASNVNFDIKEAGNVLTGVDVVATRGAIFSDDRTGAGTNVKEGVINALDSAEQR